MSSTDRNHDKGSLVTGMVLILVGVLFAIDRFTDTEFSEIIRTWWPLVIVAVGLPKVLRVATLWNGLWLVAVGGWLQAIQLDLFGMTYHNSWPLLLIVLGGGMVVRSIVEGMKRREEPNGL